MEVVVEGKAFSSMCKACEEYQASRNKVARYMVAHPEASAEDAILVFQGTLQKVARVRRCETNLDNVWIGYHEKRRKRAYYQLPGGEKHDSFASMAKEFGIDRDPKTVLTHLENYVDKYQAFNWNPTEEDVLEAWADVKKTAKDWYRRRFANQAMAELLEEARQNALPGVQIGKKKATQLLKQGMTREEVVENLSQAILSFEYNGQQYAETAGIIQCIKDNHLNPECIVPVIRKHLLDGMTFDQAILLNHDHIAREKLPPVTLEMWGWNPQKRAFLAPNGQWYKSRRAMANDYHRDYGNVMRRLAYGTPLEEALTAEKIKNVSNKNEFILEEFGYNTTLGGYSIDSVNVYPTYREMCQKNGISVVAWRLTCENRLDKQWLLDHKDFPSQKLWIQEGEKLKCVGLGTACAKTKRSTGHMNPQTVIFRCLKLQNDNLQEVFDSMLQE